MHRVPAQPQDSESQRSQQGRRRPGRNFLATLIPHANPLSHQSATREAELSHVNGILPWEEKGGGGSESVTLKEIFRWEEQGRVSHKTAARLQIAPKA